MRPSDAASTPFPSPDGRTTVGGIGGAGRDDKSYDDVFDIDGCYFVYVFVRGTGRSHKLEARKEADRRRKERIGTVPLLELSRHRTSETGVQGFP